MMMALGGYELQVTLHSFDNPGRRCADKECRDCCEILCDNSLKCSYYFSFCQRPAGTPVSYVPDQDQGNCSTLVTSRQSSDGSNIAFTQFNISNPITFSVASWVSKTHVVYVTHSYLHIMLYCSLMMEFNYF